MFQFPALARRVSGVTGFSPDGLPHSETCGSKVICTLPQLIAAYRVLHRLREPRHPPCALSYFLILSLRHCYCPGPRSIAAAGARRISTLCIYFTMSKTVIARKGEVRRTPESNRKKPRPQCLRSPGVSPIRRQNRNPGPPSRHIQQETLFPIADAKVQLFSRTPNIASSFFSDTRSDLN